MSFNDPLSATLVTNHNVNTNSVAVTPTQEFAVTTVEDELVAFFGAYELVPHSSFDALEPARTVYDLDDMLVKEHLSECISSGTALLNTPLTANDLRHCLVQVCTALLRTQNADAVLTLLQVHLEELPPAPLPDIEVCRADALVALTRVDEACQILHGVFRNNSLVVSERFFVLSALAVHYITAHRVEEAIRLVEEFTLRFPDRIDALLLQSRILLHASEHNRVDVALDHASSIDIEGANAREIAVVRACLFLARGTPEQAITLLNPIVAQQSSDPITSQVLSVALCHDGNLQRALLVLTDSIRADPFSALQPAVISQLKLLKELMGEESEQDGGCTLKVCALLVKRCCPERYLPQLMTEL